MGISLRAAVGGHVHQIRFSALGCNLERPRSRENKSTIPVDNCADKFPWTGVFP
ncbi:hypothetical protein SL1157_0743 [Ruegeria lacuscaerulensis ITI-1157]|nr:hypothetical protein SL1157_0743 [Ruegeria lacuscaerulensis ITI-1157]